MLADFRKLGQVFLVSSIIFSGADRGTRTPKDFSTASLVLRVYQFRHIRILYNALTCIVAALRFAS